MYTQIAQCEIIFHKLIVHVAEAHIANKRSIASLIILFLKKKQRITVDGFLNL